MGAAGQQLAVMLCYDCVTSGDVRRAHFALFVAVAVAIQLPTTINATAAGAEAGSHHPFVRQRRAAVHDRVHGFRGELVKKMGEGVDLDEVSLDMARYDDPTMQEAMVEYLEKRQPKWQPDLVVPIGAPALIFVANHYDRLFPGITNPRRRSQSKLLPQGEWEKNAAYVGHEISISGFIEDMLQVAPATKNIDLVLGATSLDHRWREAIKRKPHHSRAELSSPTTTIFPSTR